MAEDAFSEIHQKDGVWERTKAMTGPMSVFGLMATFGAFYSIPLTALALAPTLGFIVWFISRAHSE